MPCESLSLMSFIDEMKEVTDGPHSRRFCFVVGAGASRSSGIPSGQELVDRWDRELSQRNREAYEAWKQTLGITEGNKYGFYSHYYEKRYQRNPSDGYNLLSKLMESAKPSSGYIMLAHLLATTDHNVAITTNFDHLMEDAISYYIQGIPLVIGHEFLSHYVTRKLRRPTIVKIHRDLLFDPANMGEEVDKLHENWARALGTVFSDYNPIFIGYAGNDNSLMDFLVENAEKFASGDWCCPYWLLYGDDKAEGKVDEFLEKAKGYTISHMGFDEVLYLMGAAFDYKLPYKKVFVADAEKRYNDLKDAIDQFTAKTAGDKETSAATEPLEIGEAVQKVTRKSPLQRIYYNALDHNNMERYDRALEEVQKLIKREPDNPRYLDLMSTTLYEMRRYDEALDAKQRAIEIEPDNAAYHFSLSTLLYTMKRYDKSLLEARKALELNSDKTYYGTNIGSAQYRLGCYNEALFTLNEILEKLIAIKQPHITARAYIHRGLTKIQLALQNDSDDFVDAINDLDKAIELNSDDYRNYRDRAEGFLLMNRLDDAERDLDQAASMDDKDPDTFALYALLWEKRGDLEKSQAYAQQAKDLGYIEPLEYAQVP